MTCSQRHEVGHEDTAVALGSGDVPVLGTPRLLAWLEQVTVVAARPHLAEGQVSVGAAVRIRHLAPTSVGEVVTVHADVLPAEGSRRRTFAVRAENARGDTIADGEIDRVAAPRTAFT
ncbi:hotdog domain-containing protein [Saccharopolyspora sp. NPDC047091]|uniref:thioesterase family protein n=1 Tax=Saccharopolyspora sp. NPDC047091 TaxID=3155924 RepID=UPI0034104135